MLSRRILVDGGSVFSLFMTSSFLLFSTLTCKVLENDIRSQKVRTDRDPYCVPNNFMSKDPGWDVDNLV